MIFAVENCKKCAAAWNLNWHSAVLAYTFVALKVKKHLEILRQPRARRAPRRRRSRPTSSVLSLQKYQKYQKVSKVSKTYENACIPFHKCTSFSYLKTYPKIQNFAIVCRLTEKNAPSIFTCSPSLARYPHFLGKIAFYSEYT